MYEEEQNYHPDQDQNEHNFEQSGEQRNYTYQSEHIWTNEPHKPQRPKNQGLLVALIVALAVVSVCMSTLFLLVFFTRNQAMAGESTYNNPYSTQETSSVNTGDTINQSVVINNEGASNALEKAESLDTINYEKGSAGDNAYSSIAEAVAHIKDSVVEIVVKTTSTSYFGVPVVSQGAGSGVILSKDGYIVTNNHVIEDSDSIKITLTNGHSYSAVLIGTSEAHDLAVVKIEPEEDLTVAQMGCSADLLLGEEVIAIGNPLGSLGGTVTNGIVSALQRRINIDNNILTVLQTNAAISPGNSGGGLFNMAGQLIGVVNAKSISSGAEGIGFAIPIDIAYDVIKDLMDYGFVRGQVDHGLTLYDVNSAQQALYYFNSRSTGVYVWDSKYEDVPLKYGDRIVSVNGINISKVADVTNLITGYQIGEQVEVVVIREGKEVKTTITLHEYIPNSISFKDQ